MTTKNHVLIYNHNVASYATLRKMQAALNVGDIPYMMVFRFQDTVMEHFDAAIRLAHKEGIQPVIIEDLAPRAPVFFPVSDTVAPAKEREVLRAVNDASRYLRALSWLMGHDSTNPGSLWLPVYILDSFDQIPMTAALRGLLYRLVGHRIILQTPCMNMTMPDILAEMQEDKSVSTELGAAITGVWDTDMATLLAPENAG